ncbi:MAG: hypothetical protein P4M12_11060 [Gammaproteobacteria bacterium]|nr:hypothetical protein [Gammaproteobacteria bacterium]
MTKSVIFIRDDNNQYRAVIDAISDWEGFEKLITFVQKYYSAEVLEEYDGPDARKWILESNGHRFELIHDDGYGNYFLARTQESEDIIRTIGKDLEERLKNT